VEGCDLQLNPLALQSSDSRWPTAPHLPQVPDQTGRPDRPDSALPAKDDVVGWLDEILIDSAKLPGRTFDSAAQTP
jgi:hypothetical protein